MQHFAARLIRCAAGVWSIQGGANKAICVAKHESGLYPSAVSPGGAYLGLFQHARQYWPGRYRHYTFRRWHLRSSALNGRTAAIVTIRMVHDSGWSPWVGSGC